ncbi:MAG: hypothetical protein Q7J51_09890 [Sheuella sp.]|nr:hypothetical protein [Sheuella sp.]
MKLVSVCILLSLVILHADALSSSVKNKDVAAMDNEYSFPDWMLRENIVENLSLNGLLMKTEFFTIKKNMKEFIHEIVSFIPEGSVLIRNSDGLQISWLVRNISYVFLITDQSSVESARLNGILSSIVLNQDKPLETQSTTCPINWLPDDAKLIFSMGDKVGGVNQARIEGYISSLSYSEVRALVERRLKIYGWISLAQYPHRSSLGYSNLFEAFCGNRHVRIDLQKKIFQTRISVMSIEK